MGPDPGALLGEDISLSFLLFRIPARWDTAIRETPAFGKDFLVPWSIFPRPQRFFFVHEEEDEDKE